MSFSISRLSLASAISVALILPGSPAAFADGCQTPDLTAIDLGSAASGDPITLSGTGFCDSADEHFAWVWNGSQGLPISIHQTNSEDLLGATVGPTAETITGQVILWTGQPVNLPDAIIEAPTGTYWIHNTRAFLQTEKDQGPIFTATPGTVSGVTSTLVAGELRLNFAPPSNLMSPFSQSKAGAHGEGISVYVVIQTCGEPTGDGGNDGGGQSSSSDDPIFVPYPIGWFGRFEAGCFGAAGACAGTPTQTVAMAIEDRFASQGLRARVEGSEVVISHRGCPIETGFATVDF